MLREGANPGQRCSGGALHQLGELLSIQACAVCLPNGPSLDDDLRRYASPGRGWFRGRSTGLPTTPGTIPASRVPRVSPSHRKRGTKCHRTSCHQSSELCRRCSNFPDGPLGQSSFLLSASVRLETTRTFSNEGWCFEDFASNRLRRLMICPLISPNFSQFFPSPNPTI